MQNCTQSVAPPHRAWDGYIFKLQLTITGTKDPEMVSPKSLQKLVFIKKVADALGSQLASFNATVHAGLPLCMTAAQASIEIMGHRFRIRIDRVRGFTIDK